MIGEVALNDVLCFRRYIHSPTGGGLADGDSTPTVDVQEDNGTPATMGASLSEEATGEVYITIDCASGNGYEVGKRYNAALFATVGGEDTAQQICEFIVVQYYTDEYFDSVGEAIQDIEDTVDAIRASQVMYEGTAAGGSASTIVLAGDQSFASSALEESIVRIISGSGAGQCRRISGFVSGTETATVIPQWDTSPTATSVIEIYPSASGIGDNGIATASFQAFALTSTVFASDCITAAKLAADVTTELQAGLATSAALATLDGKVDAVDDYLDTEIAALITAVNTVDDLLDTEVGAIIAAIAALPSDVEDAVLDALLADHDDPGSVGEALAGVDTAPVLDAISDLSDDLAIVDGLIDALTTAVADLPDDGAEATWDHVLEGSATAGDLVRATVSGVLGKVTNFLTGTLVFKGFINSAKTRATVTTNSTGRVGSTPGDLTP